MSTAEQEKKKALTKDGFSRAIQPNSGRSLLDTLDTLFPETGKKTSHTTSRSRVPKPPGRGKPMKLKFSDDNMKEPLTTLGPSILEVIDSIRSPSPDFGSDDMDDLIRAMPDSALDVNNYGAAVGLTVDDVEEISSPPDAPQVSRKRSYGSPPAPERPSKRMRNISDWEGDIGRRRFRPVRSDSVQDVGTLPTDIVLVTAQSGVSV